MNDKSISVNEMPALVAEMTSFINRMPAMNTWKRLRIAVSPEEWVEIRNYYFARDGKAFRTIRGVPIYIETKPLNATIYGEVP